MKVRLAEEAGTALFWKAIQQGGVNLISLLRLLVLARLLSPEDFGLLAIAMTGIGFLLRMTDFGMTPALVQRKDATDLHYNAAWTVGVLRAVTICGVVFLAAPFIGELFAEPRAVDIIRVLSVLPLVEAAASIKIAELIRKLRFRSLGIVKLSDALANTMLSVALAPFLGVWALVAGTLAGPAVYVTMSYILAPHRPRVSLDRSAVRSLINYGRWIFVTGLVTVSAGAFLRVLISRGLGASGLGLYFLAAKLAFLPNDIASEVVGAVSFPLYARMQSNISQATKAFRAIFTSMLLVLTPVFVLVFVLTPSLIENVLGSQWQGTDSLIRLLAVVGLIGLVGDAAVPVLKGLGRPYRYALLEGGQSLLLFIFAWGFIGQFGLMGAGYAWLFAVSGTVIVSIVFLRQSLHLPFTGTGKPCAVIALASAAGGIIAFYMQQYFAGLLGLSLCILAAMTATTTTLWLLNKALELKLARGFARVFPQTAPLLDHFD